MTEVLPLTFIGDRQEALQLLGKACGEQALWVWISTHVGVKLPDAADVNVNIEAGPSPPGVDSTALLWVKTSSPAAVAIRTDQGWEIKGSREGEVRPFREGVNALRDNAFLVELGASEMTSLGLAGRWGRVTNPPITGVVYT